MWGHGPTYKGNRGQGDLAGGDSRRRGLGFGRQGHGRVQRKEASRGVWVSSASGDWSTSAVSKRAGTSSETREMAVPVAYFNGEMVG